MSQQVQRATLENAETYAVAAAFLVLIGLLVVLIQRNQSAKKAPPVPIAMETPVVAPVVKQKPKPKRAGKKKQQKKLAQVAQVKNAARGKDEDVEQSMATFIATAEAAQKASTKKSKKQRRAEKKAEEAALLAANATVDEKDDDMTGFKDVYEKPQKAKKAQAEPEKKRRPKPFFKNETLQATNSEDEKAEKPKPKRKQKPLPVAPKLSDFAAIPSLDVMINAITTSQQKNIVHAAPKASGQQRTAESS
jgi:hypothetical protein